MTTDPDAAAAASFADLGLPPALLGVLDELGYETPTPVQASAIPALLAGRDLVGRAPTGTGKTAAFALPLLASLAASPGDASGGRVRALVLTPTRELAIQVAAAFERYAAGLGNLHALAVYGGQEYGGQIRRLQRGVEVVVGTPGRVMDHVRRGTLVLDALEALVLDEGDEMLRMGFVDDVEWLLERTPATRRTALFSATMPPAVRRIAERHLEDPAEVSVQGRSATAATVRQRVWMVKAHEKLDALARVLEAEPFEGALVFVRTKSATVELAERLQGLGHAAAAINGDMPQRQREQTVERLRRGDLDVLVATDVVARGLDVERVSLVVNHDVPYDVDSYVHRIGRTGRAGRSGEAILFVTPRERGLLGAIERATRQKLEPLKMPTPGEIAERRVAAFLARVDETLADVDLGPLERALGAWRAGSGASAERTAAALAHLAMGERSPASARGRRDAPRDARAAGPGSRPAPRSAPAPAAPSGPKAPGRAGADAPGPLPTPAPRPAPPSAPIAAPIAAPSVPTEVRTGAPGRPAAARPREGIEMERFRVEVGREHGVEARNLVGAIASEADIDSAWIGRIEIRDDHSVVELPEGMPKFLLKSLRRVWVCGRRLDIARLAGAGEGRTPSAAGPRPATAGGQTVGPGPATRAPGGPAAGGAAPGRPGARRAPGRGGERPPKRAPKGKPGPRGRD